MDKIMKNLFEIYVNKYGGGYINFNHLYFGLCQEKELKYYCEKSVAFISRLNYYREFDTKFYLLFLVSRNI